MKPRRFPLSAVLAILLAAATAVRADSDGWEDDDHDYDRARRASERGEILPIGEILARLGEQVPGKVLDLDLEREHGSWIYEIKVLDARGRLLELKVDARSGRVIRHEDDH